MHTSTGSRRFALCTKNLDNVAGKQHLGMKFFSDIRLLILAIWLGAAVFFIGVAQSSFAVLPERELAGTVVNRNPVAIKLWRPWYSDAAAFIVGRRHGEH